MRKVVKQAKSEITIGSIIQLYSASQIYDGVVMTVFTLGMAFNTTWRVWILSIFPWMQWLNFPLFISSLLLGKIVMILLHKKYALPSVIRSSNRWSWSWNNPQRAYFENQEKNMRKLMQANGLKYEEIDKKVLESLGVEHEE